MADLADLADLAALKLQLEAEASPDSYDAQIVSGELSSDGSDDASAAPEEGDSPHSEGVSEAVLAAVLRHTAVEASQLDPQMPFSMLGIGRLARWAIASTIETELRISMTDVEIESWDSVADILISAKEK